MLVGVVDGVGEGVKIGADEDGGSVMLGSRGSVVVRLFCERLVVLRSDIYQAGELTKTRNIRVVSAELDCCIN